MLSIHFFNEGHKCLICPFSNTDANDFEIKGIIDKYVHLSNSTFPKYTIFLLFSKHKKMRNEIRDLPISFDPLVESEKMKILISISPNLIDAFFSKIGNSYNHFFDKKFSFILVQTLL